MKRYIFSLSVFGLICFAFEAQALAQDSKLNFWNSLFRPSAKVNQPSTVVQPSAQNSYLGNPSAKSDAVGLLAPNGKCETFRPLIEEAKSEMEKKNDLERNACQLYKNWVQLWRASECDSQEFTEAESLTCPSGLGAYRVDRGLQAMPLRIPSCDEIFTKWQTSSQWAHAGIQACDYSLFETGCKPMADAAEDCGDWQCTQNCSFKYGCDPASFKQLIAATPIYFNDSARLQGCLDQLRRSGI